jgi:hypothetical protein
MSAMRLPANVHFLRSGISPDIGHVNDTDSAVIYRDGGGHSVVRHSERQGKSPHVQVCPVSSGTKSEEESFLHGTKPIKPDDAASGGIQAGLSAATGTRIPRGKASSDIGLVTNVCRAL